MQLKLYKNFPINDYANQCYYSNESQRDSDFDSYTDRTVSDLASCDKSKREIRLNVSYYVGNQYNYGCIIENNKRYYIFINSVEWKSNLNTCILHYAYDYWQTYCYDITLEQSYVEREHVTDDTFGNHIVDEGLPVSDYLVQTSTLLNGGSNNTFFAVSVCDTGELFKGLWNGIKALNILPFVRISKNEYSPAILYTDTMEKMQEIVNTLVNDNKSDSIVGMYSFPEGAIGSKSTAEFCHTDDEDNRVLGRFFQDGQSMQPVFHDYTIQRPATIDGYTPHNNKCFTHPFCFCNFTNNNGNSTVGKFEFSNNKTTVNFRYHLNLIEGGVSFGVLRNYDGVSLNFDYSIQGNVNIEIPYITNTFSAYMSANQNAIANQYDTISRNFDYANNVSMYNGISSVLNGGISLMSGGVTDITGVSKSTLGIAGSVGNTLLSYEGNTVNATNQYSAIQSALKDVQSKGNVAHGSYTGSSPIIFDDVGFKAQLLTVNKENIKMIDNYFDMYGYRVNTIKKPQFNSRPYWNFIKTSGVNLVGNIPQDALNVIKSMFDKGVTMWHKTSYFYKYTQYASQNRP